MGFAEWLEGKSVLTEWHFLIKNTYTWTTHSSLSIRCCHYYHQGLPQDHFPTEKIQLCLEQSDNVSKTRNKARRSVSFILIHTSAALLCLPFTKETGCQSVIHLPDQYLLWPYRASVLPLVLMAAMVKTVASMVETYLNNCSNREIQN